VNSEIKVYNKLQEQRLRIAKANPSESLILEEVFVVSVGKCRLPLCCLGAEYEEVFMVPLGTEYEEAFAVPVGTEHEELAGNCEVSSHNPSQLQCP
jgi:hypothetical protein